jgi:alpha 1,3-glucosidase
MQKDAVHYGGWEHRDIHNINGMIYVRARIRLFGKTLDVGLTRRPPPRQQNLSSLGLIAREDPPKRPFVLTRAYYAGSQRFGAAWTGDNLGDWPHLASTVPMLLSNSISGMVFTGCECSVCHSNGTS